MKCELDFLRHFKNDNFTSVSVRIFRGYGKNSRDVIFSLGQRRFTEKRFLCTDLKVFLIIYMPEIQQGLLKLGLSDYEGVINLRTGRSRRVAELVEILRKHFPNMSSEEVASDIPFEASQADLTELRKTINWVPEEDLETTIPAIIAFEKSREEEQSISLQMC